MYLEYSSMPFIGIVTLSTVASAPPAAPNKATRANTGTKLLSFMLGNSSNAFGVGGAAKLVNIAVPAKGSNMLVVSPLPL